MQDITIGVRETGQNVLVCGIPLYYVLQLHVNLQFSQNKKVFYSVRHKQLY